MNDEDTTIQRQIKDDAKRNIFYIDVGNLPSERAIEIIEKVKAEIISRNISG